MLECEEMEGLLSLHERGELDEASVAPVRVHLEGCAGCRGVLESFRALSAACAEDAVEPVPEEGIEAMVAGVLEAAETPVRAPEAAWPEVLTLEEVADYLRVTAEELEVELDALPTFEFAGRLRVRRSALERWIEERERASRRRRLLSLVEGA